MAGPFLIGTWIWFFVILACALAEVRGPPRQLESVEGYKKSRTGRTVKLVCPVAGNPKPLTTWTKDGESINDGWERFRVRISGLKIKDVVVEDSGQYVCRATNGFGSVSINFTLSVLDDEHWETAAPKEDTDTSVKDGKTNGEQVHKKPELQGEHPVNTTIKYGGTTSFQCRVRSDTQPHIQWLKRVEPHNTKQTPMNATIDMDGQKFLVLPAGEIWRRPDGSYLNKLMIKQATEIDAGMYICLGANNMGFSFKSAFLEVLPEDSPVGPSSEGKNGNIEDFIRRNVTVIQPSQHDGLDPIKKALLIGLPLGFGFLFCLGAIVCTYNCNRSQANNSRTPPPPNQLSNHLAKKSDIHQSRNTLPNGSGLPNGGVHPNGVASHHSDCEQSLPLTGHVTSAPTNSLQTFPINSCTSRETALNRYVEYPVPSSYTDTLNSDRSRGSSRLHSHHSSHLHHPHHYDMLHHGSNSLYNGNNTMHHGSNSLVHHC